MRIIESVFHKKFKVYRYSDQLSGKVVGARIFFHPGNHSPHIYANGGKTGSIPHGWGLRHLRAHRSTLSKPSLKLFHIGITDRHHQQCQKQTQHLAADDRHRDRRALRSAGSDAEGSRNQAGNDRQRRHQNRAEPHDG